MLPSITCRPLTSTSSSILKEECNEAPPKAPSPPSIQRRCPTFRMETKQWQPVPTTQQQRPRCNHIAFRSKSIARRPLRRFTQTRAIGKSSLRQWCLPSTAASQPRLTRASCIHRCTQSFRDITTKIFGRADAERQGKKEEENKSDIKRKSEWNIRRMGKCVPFFFFDDREKFKRS